MPDIPGNTTTSATISVGGTSSGSLEVSGDTDWYRLELTQGEWVRVDLTGIEGAFFWITDSTGVYLFKNGHTGSDPSDSSIAFRAPYSGTFYIDVSSHSGATGTYQLSVSQYVPPPVGTVDDFADQLVGDSPRRFDASEGDVISVNLTALTEEGRTYAQQALTAWSDIIGIDFVEVTTGGQITFDDQESAGWASITMSGGFITSAHVNVDVRWLVNSGIVYTYLHEIGHALGLSHAGDYFGGPQGFEGYPDSVLFANDSHLMSVMSYVQARNNSYIRPEGVTYTQAFVDVGTPMMGDIQAMSLLYGLSTSTRTGNTTYGFNSNADRAVYDATANTTLAYTVFDSGGLDTLDYSGFSQDQLIDLREGHFSNVGGAVMGTVAIAMGTVIENAIGGNGADTIIGNSARNLLDGGAGADTLTGLLGNDTYVVDDVGDVVTEAKSAGKDTVAASLNYTLGANVENLTLTGTAAISGTGNALANVITGNSAANTLKGGHGNDRLIGGAGNDVLSGGGGMDKLFGGSGIDTLSAGLGNDVLNGGTGADLFHFDTALNGTSNVDRISDFSVADDTIQLDDDVFTAAGAVGTLSASAFVTGTAALDANDRIIYDSATGKIYYDADGTGAGAQVLFAQVTAGLALTNADFAIVG